MSRRSPILGGLLGFGVAVCLIVMAEAHAVDQSLGSHIGDIKGHGLSKGQGGTVTGDITMSGADLILDDGQFVTWGGGTGAKLGSSADGQFDLSDNVGANSATIDVSSGGFDVTAQTLQADGVTVAGFLNVDNTDTITWGGLSATASDVISRVYATREQFVWNLGDDAGRNWVIGGNNGGATAATNELYDHAESTNPTLWIHSDEDPDNDNTQWISLSHDQTDAVVGVGSGDLKLDAEVEATGISAQTSGVVCVKSDGNLGTCSDAPDMSGDCTCG